jgi:hypothetical protein
MAGSEVLQSQPHLVEHVNGTRSGYSGYNLNPMNLSLVSLALLRTGSSKPMMTADHDLTCMQSLTWAEVFLCLVLVVYRTWVQFRRSRKFRSNDVLIIFAMICHFLAAFICQLAMPSIYKTEDARTAARNGEIVGDEFSTAMELYLRYRFCLNILSWLTLWSARFSLLLFFRAFCNTFYVGMGILWWFSYFVAASTFFTTIMGHLFSCGSPSNLFKPGMAHSLLS